MNRKKFVSFLSAVLLASSLLSGCRSSAPVVKSAQTTQTPAASPVPFEELTVPFLRQRSYNSQLNQLQKISESTTFTTYLTSYSSDGFKVNCLLTQPKGDMPAGGWPAIVFVHGYIEPTVYRTQEKYVEYVNYLARNGFVVFKIDLRGHGDSEGEANGAYYSSDYTIDTLNAYNALQQSSFVNPKKVGVWGHSMAGNVVLRSMVVKEDIPAVVIWAGAVYSYQDLQKYGLNDNSYRPPTQNTERLRKREALFNAHGQFNADNPFWKNVVLTNFLDNVKGSLQIHHAVDDTVVSIGYSRDLISTLAKTNIPHQLFEYSSGGHNISGDNFNIAMNRTVEFFKEKLK